MIQTPVDMDEEDPDEEKGIYKPLKKSEMVYGNKLEYLQQNPITLLESPQGVRDTLDSF